MLRIAVFSVLISICVGELYSQAAISGYLNISDSTAASKEIHLSQIALEAISGDEKGKRLATVPIAEDGFFQFRKDLISEKQSIYRLQYDVDDETNDDTPASDHFFILSKKDSIRFEKSEEPFTTYVTSNVGDMEWHRLRQFERRLREGYVSKGDSLSDGYLGAMKTYAKDSLQILTVKLIGIKQLDTKNLLDKDIAKNPEYYVALLAELKESDIERADYLFLENKLAFLTTEAAENRYATSKIINILLGLAIAGLLLVLWRRKSKSKMAALSGLSKQERTVQGLILEGKSNKEIANELFISLSTVKSHITNIYSKLQVSNRQELVRKTQNS